MKKVDNAEGPDFGEFTIGAPDEQMVFAQLWELAAKNTTLPGMGFMRLVATHPTTNAPIGIKTYSLDTNRHRLVVVEERDGRVTARRTIELNAAPAEPDTRPPALDPGPEEATFHRESFTAADLDIEDELRDWTLETIGDRLPGMGAVAAGIGIFRPRFQDAFMPAQPLLPANVARLGATLSRLRLRAGVVRAMAEGWLDTGEPNGMAFVMEWLEGEGWWLATRPFRRRAGPIGEWTGPWHQLEGSGPGQVPMALRALRWPLAAAAAYDVGEPKDLEAEEMEVAFGELPPDQVLPTTAEGFAALAAFPFERDVLAGKGVHEPRVVVFRGRSWERWNLEGPLPTDIDDVLRNICRRGADPDAMVLVQFAIVPLDGATLTKCLMSTAEHRGARFARVMEIRADASGKVAGIRYLRAGAEAEDPELWIGVEPLTMLTTMERSAGGDS